MKRVSTLPVPVSRALLPWLLALLSTTLGTAAVAQTAYGPNSWETMIPASCKNYFDGCNNCRRGAEGQPAACTRKACQAYRQPRCLDADGNAANAAGGMKVVGYTCDDNARFEVYFGEYRADDQRVALGDGEIMLADRQTHTAHRLERVRAASGEKYSDGKLEFWSHGNEAMLRQGGKKPYRNCRIGG